MVPRGVFRTEQLTERTGADRTQPERTGPDPTGAERAAGCEQGRRMLVTFSWNKRVCFDDV